ncbi:hypothetical protein PYCCODRAFT_691976 [Trametes coccinea BRFM310]|uniref:Uncharacterized protein n=1 Tax=Trametes coccinea (strain BRFM310) TaxID=1353009 RepID=A0A1Y2IHD4_TRAC3|nr:hypothetical protein PYCCODRAFT_691976 [Trametes coccinea BRFM310]
MDGRFVSLYDPPRAIRYQRIPRSQSLSAYDTSVVRYVFLPSSHSSICYPSAADPAPSWLLPRKGQEKENDEGLRGGHPVRCHLPRDQVNHSRIRGGEPVRRVPRAAAPPRQDPPLDAWGGVLVAVRVQGRQLGGVVECAARPGGRRWRVGVSPGQRSGTQVVRFGDAATREARYENLTLRLHMVCNRICMIIYLPHHVACRLLRSAPSDVSGC